MNCETKINILHFTDNIDCMKPVVGPSGSIVLHEAENIDSPKIVYWYNGTGNNWKQKITKFRNI